MDREIVKRLAVMQRDIDDIKSSIRLLLGLSDSEAKRELQKTLDSESKKITYELTDGTRSAHDIAKITGTSISTIHRWWRDWSRDGLIRESFKNGRVERKRIFSLEDLGINVPDISFFSRKDTGADYAINKDQLRTVLRNYEMFRDPSQLAKLAERVFDRRYLFSSGEDLIEKVTETFFDSPKRSQLIFIQALRDEARTTSSSFAEYLEKWERNIRGEDRI